MYKALNKEHQGVSVPENKKAELVIVSETVSGIENAVSVAAVSLPLEPANAV